MAYTKEKKVFMNIEERKDILLNIECVDEVITFNDDDIGSCIDALEKIKNKYPNEKIIFCNGGDRNKNNIPEMKSMDIEFKFGVGGDDKKTLLHHFSKIGNMIVRIEYGGLFIIFMILKR